MAATSALPQQLRGYLATCSPEHADQIIDTLRQALQRNFPAPGANVGSSMPAHDGAKAAKVAKANKKQRAKKEKREGATSGPKRPLNSWMAFRKYYSGSLAPHTQKTISKVLTSWWKADPFEAKWAMLAKAYSILRGNREKEDAPLDEFFRICAPLIGVIPPEEYQQLMGWAISAALDGAQDKTPQVIKCFTPDFDNFPQKYTTTNLSVENLVSYCMQAGYVTSSGNSAPHAGTQGALTMAVQPASTVQAMQPASTVQSVAVPQVMESSMPVPSDPLSFSLFDQLQGNPAGTTTESTGQSALTTATTVITDAGAYPYSNLFDPTSQFDVSFNPAGETALQDGGRFDAYDPAVNMTVDDPLHVDVFGEYVNYDGSA